jgi:hypothetical protein
MSVLKRWTGSVWERVGGPLSNIVAGQVIARTHYDPGSLAAISRALTAYANVDGTNLAVTFTAPPTGNVIVDLQAMGDAGTGYSLQWNLRSGGSDIAGTGRRVADGPSLAARHISIKITGLTPGASYTYTWGHASTDVQNVRTIYGGGYGPAIMEVKAA